VHVLRTKSFLPLRSSLGAGPFSLGSSLCNVLFREELPVSPGAPRGISASHGAPCVARGALRVHFSYAQWARGRRELLACAKDTRRAYDVHVHTPLLPLPPLPLRLPPPPPPMPPPPPPPPPAPPHPPPPPLLLAIMVCASSVLCARAPRVTEPPGPFAFAFVAPPLLARAVNHPWPSHKRRATSEGTVCQCPTFELSRTKFLQNWRARGLAGSALTRLTEYFL
jgi:hypothetical protein